MTSLLDRIQNKRAALASKGERPMKLAGGQNILRVLPNWTGDPDGVFHQEWGQHFIKNAQGVNLATYICTANTFGTPCSVCEAVAQAAAHLDPSDEAGAKMIYEARGNNRILVNAILRTGTHANAKTEPVIVELAPSVFDQILAIAENYLSQHNINIFSLDAGYDLTITKTGAALDTKYTVVSSPVASKVDAGVLTKCRSLADYAKQESEANLQKALVAVKTTLLASASGKALPAPAPTPSAAPRLAANVVADAVPTPAPSRLAATAPVDMEEAPLVDAKLQSTPTPAATPSAASELDELEELLRDDTLKAA